MTYQNRRAAISAYKERKPTPGIFALRCGETCWVGRAPDLSTVQRRLWFTLAHGSHPHPALQAAWRTQGEAAFTFEVIEALDIADVPEGYLRDGVLKDRLAYWKAALSAQAI